jgi:Zn-dependent metallo-hydrolase RNA specificity domain
LKAYTKKDTAAADKFGSPPLPLIYELLAASAHILLTCLARRSNSSALSSARAVVDVAWLPAPGVECAAARHRIPLVVHHASGHAAIPDLQRLVSAIAPGRVVPIHSAAGDRFAEFFPRVDRQRDGTWCEV